MKIRSISRSGANTVAVTVFLAASLLALPAGRTAFAQDLCDVNG